MSSSRSRSARANSPPTPAAIPATQTQGATIPTAGTPSAPAALPPHLSSATPTPTTTRFEDLPCLTPGSLGADTICEPSRVFTGDGLACDASRQSELVFRLANVVTQLPPVPGTPDFLTILSQADEIARSSTGAVAFRTRLALAGIAEYAVRVALASGLLKESNGCVVLPTEADVRMYVATEAGLAQREAAAGGGGAVQPAPHLGGGSGPTPRDTTTATVTTDPSSTVDGPGSSGTLPRDDAELVDLFTTQHSNYEAALLVALNNMDGGILYTFTKQLQKTPLRVCEAVRRLPRANLFVYDNTLHTLLVGAGGEALPEMNGLVMERARKGSEC